MKDLLDDPLGTGLFKKLVAKRELPHGREESIHERHISELYKKREKISLICLKTFVGSYQRVGDEGFGEVSGGGVLGF